MTLTKLKPSHVPRNHPKRQGRHHRQSQHYAKAYWPYLPVFAVLGLGILLNSVVSRSHHNVLGYATSISNQVLLAETNGERLSHHAEALNLNAQLTATANVADYQGTGPATVIVALYGEPVGAIPVSAAAPSVLGTRTANVSRFSLLSTATWVPLLIAAVVGAAITLFFVRHALAWRKVLVHGEQFAMAHPFLDVFLMSAAVLALVLAHSAGSIL
jgi:hypothetical protein